MVESPIVRVSEGELLGKLTSTRAGKNYYSFQGIPYAKPPLGSLRFRAPQPPEPWEGVRDATEEGNECAQIEPVLAKVYSGDENCLYLNVYTPNLDGENLPVMMYIYGGGFLYGSGSATAIGPDYLVEKDVVVVTFNYRCGAFGFLCLNTPEVPGNAGLKDMVQAVRWVKENIKQFGGNPDNITLFGESAGAASTTLLTASPLSKHLINKAIVMSGTGVNNWMLQRNPVKNAIALAKLLGCESTDTDDVLEFLRTAPVRDIAEANAKLNPVDHLFKLQLMVFSPILEKEFPGVEPFMTEPFLNLLTSGRTANIPVMVGSVALEIYGDRGDDLNYYIPYELRIKRDSEEAKEIIDKIKQLYFKGNPPEAASLEEKFHLLSDVVLNVDTYRYVQNLLKVSTKPIYYYWFDYYGELNLTKEMFAGFGIKKAAHTDELGYLFSSNQEKDMKPTEEDLQMRDRMVRLWTNFAKSGNPTPEDNHILPVTWPPITKDNICYLNIGNELTIRSNPDKERMEFWEEIYQKHYKLWNQATDEATELAPNVKEVLEKEVDTKPVIVEEIVTVVEEKKEEPQPLVEDKIEESNNVQNLVETEKTVEICEEVDGDVIIIEEKITEPVKIENNSEFKEIRSVKEIVTIYRETHPENGIDEHKLNGTADKKPRPSNEIKMVQNNNINPNDVVRANDPPEDDLPKNIGVNKFVNFFESLGKK